MRAAVDLRPVSDFFGERDVPRLALVHHHHRDHRAHSGRDDGRHVVGDHRLAGGDGVTECGTEEVYFAVFDQGMDGGIMVTASHNPKDYNGFKMVLGGKAIYGDDIQKLRQRIEAEDRARREAAEAAERERCAKACEQIEDDAYALWRSTADPTEQGRSIGAGHCAQLIRATT